ncbi:desumoylating isopeptidase 1, partial [Tremellales sp. Uapishka_1]
MSKVQLYVYDLSKGMAKSLSLALTGKQIDGIWHTSVVVFGREIFFGQGIMEARPGTTHHGPPMQIIECGTTGKSCLFLASRDQLTFPLAEIDSDTFQEYLTSLHEMYTASAYHLIDFNCNHFTADVVGFLTGTEIPSWISGLPTEFLSTPFGQAMRPQIDAMFKRTSPSEHPIAGSSSLPTPPISGANTPYPLASSLLSAVAAQATTDTPPPVPPTPETSPLTLVTSLSNFTSILRQYSAVVVNFTNTAGCAPCRVIKPIYESLASEYASTYGAKGARFVEVELGVGEGRDIASRHGVSATPTFIFYRNGKKVAEMKGANKRDLESRVEEFMDECFPRHPHRKLYLPATESLSKVAITASGVPNYPALMKKMDEFAGAGAGAEAGAGAGAREFTEIEVLKQEVIPFLDGSKKFSPTETKALFEKWSTASTSLLQTLSPEQTFPVIDLLRVGLLNPIVATVLALQLSPSSSAAVDPVSPILALGVKALQPDPKKTPKPFLLTLLRFITNLTASLPLANIVLSPSVAVSNIVEILVESLLHDDTGVRTAAAGLAINLGGWRHRLLAQREKEGGKEEDEIEAEWEVEVISALIEGIGREADEEIGYRLLVAMALLIYLSPGYHESIKPLLDVLDAKGVLEKKARVWKRKEVKKLAEEVAGKLC